MASITRSFPDRSDHDIFKRVDEVMAGIARRHALDYRKDDATRTGSVSIMGGSGSYAVRDGQVTIELKYPFLVPGAMRRKIEGDIERKLDGLFGQSRAP
jgi:hypothetical protein